MGRAPSIVFYGRFDQSSQNREIWNFSFENLCTKNEHRWGLETFCMSGDSYGPNIKVYTQTYRSQMGPQ